MLSNYTDYQSSWPQDLDAVEALIQGLALFQGGVLMVCLAIPIPLFSVAKDGLSKRSCF